MVGNLLALLFLAGSIGYLVATRDTPKLVSPEELTPWNHQYGKTNPLKANGNKDMSMATEAVRRRAIAAVHRFGYRPIKESVHTTGSTSGYLESYLLTSICPPGQKQDLILDGEQADDELCLVYDGSGDTALDAGNAGTKVCGV
jgi:hypothetical protein